MRGAKEMARHGYAVIRLALWWIGLNLLAGVSTAQQCTSATVVQNQTFGSGAACYSANDTLTATGAVTVNGSASVSFIAGRKVDLQPSFRGTAGGSGTTFHAWVEVLPSNVSVSPLSGSGMSQQFTWTVSDPVGYGHLADVFAIVGANTSGVNQCYVRYNRATNLLYLADNSGGVWQGGFAPGSMGTASSYSCTLSGAGSSVTLTGTDTLSVTTALTFQSFYLGPKNTYLIAYNNDGWNSTWQQMGTWNVLTSQLFPLTTAASPSAGGTVTPGSGSYGSGSLVTVSATPAAGYRFVNWTGPVANANAATTTVVMGAAQSVTANFSVATSYTATTVPELQNCIYNMTQITTCVLQERPEPYEITSTLEVNRAVIVSGSGTRQTKLVRADSFKGDLIHVAPSGTSAPPLTGIVIRNLTVCGNSNIATGQSPAGCRRAGTQCSNDVVAWTAAWQEYEDGLRPDPPPGQAFCVDLSISNVDAGHCGASSCEPVTDDGAFSVVIDDVDFEDASGHALYLAPDATNGKRVNDVHIKNSAVNYSAVTGILHTAALEHLDKAKYCDGYASNNSGRAYADAANVFAPRNILIENNVFKGNNTGVNGGGALRWARIRNNKFENNYVAPQAGNTEGPTLDIEAQCGDQIEVKGNTFVGSAYNRTSGLAVAGRNVAVRDNVVKDGAPGISGFAFEGIALSSARDATVTDNDISGNNWNTDVPRGSIILHTSFSTGGCDGPRRDMQGATITGNRITGGQYGIQLENQDQASTNTLNGLSISSNTLTQYRRLPVAIDETVIWSGFSDPSPIQDRAAQPDIKALAVDSESWRYPRCVEPGVARQTFTFAVKDNGGSSNVAWISGLFSAKVPVGAPPYPEPLNPDLGPETGSVGCHFIYFHDSANGSLYLDGPNLDWTWPSLPSPVGAGGTDLSNEYCIIHAATSTITREQYVLKLQLDVEFPASNISARKKYIYSLGKDLQNLQTKDGAWSYWGWWATQ